jgi:hypothetical protein
LIADHPDAKEEIELVHTALVTIGQLVQTSPHVNGNGSVWKQLADRVEAERGVPCKHLDGKALFTAILRLYAATHKEMKDSLLNITEGDPIERHEEFCEQERRKRIPSDEHVKKSKKTATTAPAPKDPRIRSQGELPTKNFFAPLKSTEIEVERPGMEESTQKPDGEPQQESSSKSGRPPPIVLTSTTNLIQLQRQIKRFVTGSFEFRSIRGGTRIVTKEMADFSAIKTYLEKSKLSYFTFPPESEKPIKAVIRHLPQNTPADDISDGQVSLGFDVISVKQMKATRQTPPEGTSTVNLPFFLITLPRTAKSQELFRLPNLCHIAIRVEAYKAQNGLMQCYNCQQFGHVWANFKRTPVVCGVVEATCTRSARRKETRLQHQHAATANWRMRKKLTPPITGVAGTQRRSCSEGSPREHPKLQQEGCSLQNTTPGVSFAAALHGRTEDQQQPLACQIAVAAPAAVEPRVSAPLPKHSQQPTGQSDWARNVSSEPLGNMLRVVAVVQQK